MGDNLPPGVRQVTGALFATTAITTSGTASGVDRIRWRPGAGFAIGIWGIEFSSEGWTGTDGEALRQAIETDLDATGADVGSGTAIFRSSEGNQLVTSGFATNPKPKGISLAAPILIVQDVLHVVTATNVSKNSWAHVYYSIFEVSDASFVRIAALNLARAN